MKCPVCGSKMVGGQLCKYCGVTDIEVTTASNKRVKECRKTGNTDLICFTNILPSDVSRLKLILFTIFLGIFGVNHYYVNRNIRGTFSVVASIGSIVIFILGFILGELSGFANTFYILIYDILFFMMAINVVLWFTDIISLIFKNFKVPVVLGSKEKK